MAASFSIDLACASILASSPRSMLRFWSTVASAFFCARLRPLAGRGLLLGDLLVGLVLGVLGVADHEGDAGAAQVLQVLLLVGHVLDLEHVELEAQLVEVVLGVGVQGLRELQAVLVDLLRRELGQHLAQHAFQGLPRHVRDLLGVMPRKRSTALRMRVGSLEIFTLAMAWTASGMPPFEYALLTVHLDHEQPHVHARDRLQQRHAQGPAAAHHLVADLRRRRAACASAPRRSGPRSAGRCRGTGARWR